MNIKKIVTGCLTASVFILALINMKCSQNEAKTVEAQEIQKMKRALVNPIDSSGNFQSYWVLMDTKIDSTITPWIISYTIPEKGKRTFAAFTSEHVFAMNEATDSASAKATLSGAPNLGVDSYTIQPDSNILLSAYIFPNKLKINSLNENEMLLSVAGYNIPIKYQKVRWSK